MTTTNASTSQQTRWLKRYNLNVWPKISDHKMGLSENLIIAPEEKTVTTIKNALRLSEIALMLGPCLYMADADFIGVSPAPFAELLADTQQKWYRRAELSVLSGIGYLDARARERAVRRVSTDLALFDELSEAGAKLAEQAMSRMADEYETQLMQAYQESQ